MEGIDETGRDYNPQMGLGGNLVQEGNIMAEGEELGETNPKTTNAMKDQNDILIWVIISNVFMKIQNFLNKRKKLEINLIIF